MQNPAVPDFFPAASTLSDSVTSREIYILQVTRLGCQHSALGFYHHVWVSEATVLITSAVNTDTQFL